MSFDLYQQVILDHNRKPRNFGPLDAHTHSCHGYNPLCGDDYTIYLRIEDGIIQGVGFDGSGCAISKASASMMTQSLTGKTLSEANTIFGEFHRMVLGELEPSSTPNQLGKLKIFQGVRDFPSRVKCASLPWHAMTGAMSDDGGEISTE